MSSPHTAPAGSRSAPAPHAPRLVGLTSHTNRDFAESLGCFDAVVAYEDLEQLTADTPAVYVDMSGDAPLRERVHAHWEQQLTCSCSVGGTHWDTLGTDPRSPWLSVVKGRGPKAVEAVYRSLVEGRADPRDGHVLNLLDEE